MTMKRRELPDGTVEIEGDPDELAEYDKLKTETPTKKKKGKRKLLTEEQVLDMIHEALENHERSCGHWHPIYPEYKKFWWEDTADRTFTSDRIFLSPATITCKTEVS